MGMFDKMRNAFARNNSDEKEELERTREEQRQARIKTLLCDREMLLKELESMWNNKKVKKRIKQEVINMIVNNLEELRSMGYELSEEEQMVPVVTDDMEEEKGGAPAQTTPAAPRSINVLDLNIYDVDDRPGIPMTSVKPKKKSYDIVSLPSGGQCYKNKKDTIGVSYLTGTDEDIISSPALYRDGKVFDQLLYNNVRDEDFNPDDLCLGDADAIMVWLRATSYGYDFPVTVDDPVTGKEIKTTVNLQQLNYRPFNLVGDENGWFDFKMPSSGDEIKFKFMTRAMDRRIRRAALLEDQALNQRRMQNCLEDIAEILASSKLKDDKMPEAEKKMVLDGLKKWDEALDEGAQINYVKVLTHKMEITIMSVNGNEDREFIHDYVINLPAADCRAYRQYYTENEPGLDFEVTIERPTDEQGLGGGSFKTIFPFDYNFFLTF